MTTEHGTRATSLTLAFLMCAFAAGCARTADSERVSSGTTPNATHDATSPHQLSCPKPTIDPAFGVGTVTLRFVLDTTGLVDTTTASVVASTNPALEAHALHMLKDCRFRPFLVDGKPIRWITEMSFVFGPRPLPAPDTSHVLH